MRRRRPPTTALALTLTLTLALAGTPPAAAGLFRRTPCGPRYRQNAPGCPGTHAPAWPYGMTTPPPSVAWRPAAGDSRGTPAAPPAAAAYQAAPAPTQAAYPATPPAPAAGGAVEALQLINAWRAARGRPALSWDSALASCAAANAGVHQPGTSGGGSQTWAGVSDPVAAARLWLASPPHAAILRDAVGAVGISPCPSGCTANFR